MYLAYLTILLKDLLSIHNTPICIFNSKIIIIINNREKTTKDKPTKKISTELGECECVSEMHSTVTKYFSQTTMQLNELLVILVNLNA